jgi:hypothetical protein
MEKMTPISGPLRKIKEEVKEYNWGESKENAEREGPLGERSKEEA